MLELLEVEVAVPEGGMETGPIVIPIDVVERIPVDWLSLSARFIDSQGNSRRWATSGRRSIIKKRAIGESGHPGIHASITDSRA